MVGVVQPGVAWRGLASPVSQFGKRRVISLRKFRSEIPGVDMDGTDATGRSIIKRFNDGSPGHLHSMQVRSPGPARFPNWETPDRVEVKDVFHRNADPGIRAFPRVDGHAWPKWSRAGPA